MIGIPIKCGREMKKRHNNLAYDRAPVQLKVLPGVREHLMDIDGWQSQVRKAIDRLIQKDKSSRQERIRAEIDLLIQEDDRKELL